MAKVRKKTLKTKKKFWFQIVAPKSFGEKVIGDSYVTESSLIKGKCVSVNLRDIADKVGRQNIQINFKVNEVKDNRAYCKTLGYQFLPSSIKRLNSKNKSKIDDSFVYKTADNKLTRLKVVLVTLNKVNNSVLTSIRKRLKELLEEKVSSMSYESLIDNLIHYNLQMFLKKTLKTVYPIRTCEVRSINLELDKKARRIKSLESDKLELNKVAEEEKSVEKEIEEPKEQPKELKEPKEPKEQPKEEPKEDGLKEEELKEEKIIDSKDKKDE